jgi:hypothetical protein
VFLLLFCFFGISAGAQSYDESTAAGPPILMPGSRVGGERGGVDRGLPEPAVEPPEKLITEGPPKKKFQRAMERTFWGLRASGFFPPRDLQRLVGRGWGMGAFVRTELYSILEPQLNLDWYFASDQRSGQDNDLHLLPITIGLRFPRTLPFAPRLKWAVEPALGGVFWSSRAIRFLDAEKNTGHGFDFLASVGANVEYEWKENSLFGFGLRWQFGAGFINQSFFTLNFEWSKRF